MSEATREWLDTSLEKTEDGIVNPIDSIKGGKFWCGKTEEGLGCIVVPVESNYEFHQNGNNLFEAYISSRNDKIGKSLHIVWNMKDLQIALYFIEDLVKSIDFFDSPVNTFLRKQDVWKKYSTAEDYNRKFRLLTGLWGELYFVKIYPFAAPYWMGPTGTDQDFGLPSARVEIKTTSSKTLDTFTVSSLSQLDADKKDIYLNFFSIERSESEGYSLNDLLRSIDKDKVGKLVLEDVQDLMDELGGDFCNERLRLRDRKILEVNDSFPVITGSFLKNTLGENKADRIQNLTYTVNISGLDTIREEEFKEEIN